SVGIVVAPLLKAQTIMTSLAAVLVIVTLLATAETACVRVIAPCACTANANVRSKSNRFTSLKSVRFRYNVPLGIRAVVDESHVHGFTGSERCWQRHVG